MPCGDGNQVYSYHQEYKELSRLLCLTCQVFEKQNQFELLPFDVQEWWIDHKEKDTDRILKKVKDLKRKRKEIKRLKKELKQ